MIQARITTCIYCDSREIIKKGVRKNHNRQLQVFHCKNCLKYFTPLSGLKTKYTPTLIAKALLFYYQGNSQEEVSSLLMRKYRARIPRRTIDRWIKKYKSVCTFYPLRARALKLFKKENFIKTHLLNHRQVYVFKRNDAKLNMLLPTLGRNGQNLQEYLAKITDPSFPNAWFKDIEEDKALETPILRSSQVIFDTLPFVTHAKQNSANDLATFGLYLAKKFVDRHPMVEEFMLSCDGATVAVEVPLYITADEVAYFKRIGFYLSLSTPSRPITGHIDILQIRNGLIYILDYKPDAKRINPTNQLLLYALALASRTRLPLRAFACAWFDEKDFFQFYPLHAVHKLSKSITK